MLLEGDFPIHCPCWRSLSFGYVTIAYVAAPVTHLVSLEVGDLFGVSGCLTRLAALWQSALVTVMHIEMIIHVPAEVRSAMEPGSGANEDATGKPFRPVIAIRSTGVRWVIVIPIRTLGSSADADSYLGSCLGSAGQHK